MIRSIVETDTDKGYYQKALRAASGDSPAPVSTLIDTVTAIKHAKDDPRIVGIMANFSSANKTQQGKGLGLAQIQELRSAIQEFKEAKAKALGGEDKVSLIAYTDSFGKRVDYPPTSVASGCFALACDRKTHMIRHTIETDRQPDAVLLGFGV